MYYKYFNEDTKMKFEEYLKKNGINPRKVYQKIFDDKLTDWQKIYFVLIINIKGSDILWQWLIQV